MTCVRLLKLSPPFLFCFFWFPFAVTTDLTFLILMIRDTTYPLYSFIFPLYLFFFVCHLFLHSLFDSNPQWLLLAIKRRSLSGQWSHFLTGLHFPLFLICHPYFVFFARECRSTPSLCWRSLIDFFIFVPFPVPFLLCFQSELEFLLVLCSLPPSLSSYSPIGVQLTPLACLSSFPPVTIRCAPSDIPSASVILAASVVSPCHFYGLKHPFSLPLIIILPEPFWNLSLPVSWFFSAFLN